MGVRDIPISVSPGNPFIDSTLRVLLGGLLFSFPGCSLSGSRGGSIQRPAGVRWVW